MPWASIAYMSDKLTTNLVTDFVTTLEVKNYLDTS